MHQPIAVIDIGSNSVRLVIYQQNHPNSFHILHEQKFKVRIGEGAYSKGGKLQISGITRAFKALVNFNKTIQNYHPLSKTLCIATSALRDAPNKHLFIDMVKKKLNIDVQVIDGKREAELGAISVIHHLSISNGISIDIGGGSSDIALIQNSKIIDTYSLNLGTVRLKELFSNTKQSEEKANHYIKEVLKELPPHFKANTAIGIGGTARTLSKAISYFQGSGREEIHNFHYNIKLYEDFFIKVIHSKDKVLKELKISKNRIDTIREGTLIWKSILQRVEAKEVISSAVGIREGVFLEFYS
jgi:exopolyphosphatase/guanosine-5'-triphosphate,3'-diphosphate pyrophosphatase